MLQKLTDIKNLLLDNKECVQVEDTDLVDQSITAYIDAIKSTKLR